MVLYSGDQKIGVIHFVGIGGIGISGIAEILDSLGYRVQGSDINQNSNTKRLEKLGINIFIGHKEENIDKADYVVLSSAISRENPEVSEAYKRNIPVLKRSEMLAELMRFKYSIGISGSHGKTTTTSMIGHLFEYFNLKPTVINGGIINNKNTNAYVGSGKYLIAEADESDGTFTEVLCNIAVVTNIDKEHLSYYHSFENLKEAFRKFIMKIPFYGFAVVCYDDVVTREIVSTIENRRVIKYGINSNDLNIKAVNINATALGSNFDVEVNFPWSNKSFIIENIKISIAGNHNILNSLAAIAIAVEKNLPIDLIKQSLENFEGVNRRFTKIANYHDAIIIDDYAHHPAEIKATLQTAKLFTKDNGGRVIGIFQPHRYSRLYDLFDEFITCFDDASNIFITDVYSAGEENINNTNHMNLIESVNLYKQQASFAQYVDSSQEMIKEVLDSTIKSGDIVIFMGAGSISSIARELFANTAKI